MKAIVFEEHGPLEVLQPHVELAWHHIKILENPVELKKLETRVKYGVRKELLPLVAFKEVGRVRARKLFRAGLKSPAKLKAASVKEIADVVGTKTARKIKAQLAGY